MLTVALVLASLAALLHVYIWWMESVTWTSPRTRRTFGLTEEAANATKEMAFNQGFYNLFLAIVTIIGVVFGGGGTVGVALIFVGCGSMLAAALVLLLSSPDKRRAAITQGTLPLLAVVALLVTVLA